MRYLRVIRQAVFFGLTLFGQHQPVSSFSLRPLPSPEHRIPSGPPCSASLPPSLPDYALVQVLEVDVLTGHPSSSHLSRLRLRAFMKKLLTVLCSRPSCCEMVSCISLDGRLFSLKMARSVLRCRSVKTSRDFFGVLLLSLLGSCSFRLHASEVPFVRKETQNEKSRYCHTSTHPHMLLF